MIRKILQTRRIAAVLCLLLASLAFVTQASAQLDYDTYDIYQNGNIVGVIYVPVRGPDPSIYNEYWIMSNRYVYPSEKNPVETQIVPTAGYHYTSLTDFLTKAPWGDGYHYVTVVAFDSTSKPVPSASTAQ
jgi:hypothetical protein